MYTAESNNAINSTNSLNNHLNNNQYPLPSRNNESKPQNYDYKFTMF